MRTVDFVLRVVPQEILRLHRALLGNTISGGILSTSNEKRNPLQCPVKFLYREIFFYVRGSRQVPVPSNVATSSNICHELMGNWSICMEKPDPENDNRETSFLAKLSPKSAKNRA